ncbi:MAG: pyridoxal 5'-phosphate synthase glutaminase subunit PdxT [Candidatus Hadarchaeales archaeon]
MKPIRICVIGLQGAVEEHIEMTKKTMQKMGIEGEVIWARNVEDLLDCSGIIIPGGESTTIGKLMQTSQMFETVRKLGLSGTPVFGTCAGMIILAKKGDEQVERTGQPLLGLMDMEVVRNAFGRQRESFEADIEIPIIEGGLFRAVFIRAPAVKRVWGDARVIAEFGGRIVGVLQKNFLALAFHPELTDDTRLHEFFLKMCLKPPA